MPDSLECLVYILSGVERKGTFSERAPRDNLGAEIAEADPLSNPHLPPGPNQCFPGPTIRRHRSQQQNLDSAREILAAFGVIRSHRQGMDSGAMAKKPRGKN